MGVTVGVTYFIGSATKLTQAWVVAAWQDIGFSIVRAQVPWSNVVPTLSAWQTGPTAWIWTALDSIVQQCNTANLRIILCASTAPTFLVAAPYGVICSSSPLKYRPAPADVATFAGAIAARYNGGANGFVDCIELMNEDYSFSTLPATCQGGTLLAPVMIAAYNAVKAQSPLTCVGCAAILTQFIGAIQQWLQPLFTLGCGSILEQGYMNFHFYKKGNPPWNLGPLGSANFEIYIQTMNDLARANGFNHVPIGITEFGFATNTNYGRASNTVFTQAQQSAYLLYELQAARVSPAVQFCCIYTLDDTSDGMSLVAGAGPPPAVTYNQAYFDIKAWVASNGDWIGKPDGTITVRGRDGLINIVTP